MTMLSFPSRSLARTSPFTLMTGDIEATGLPSPTSKASSLEQAHMMLLEAQRLIADQEEKIRRLENHVQIDLLTGLLNKRGLMAALRRELAVTRRARKSMGLLVLINLDGFRNANETYGHMTGDSILQTFASILLNEVRSSDTVARLSGDCFALLLPQISAKAVFTRLEKLERVLNSRVMHDRDRSIPLRACLGHAVLHEKETPESLLISADTKLYAQKAKKRASGVVVNNYWGTQEGFSSN